MTATVFDAGGKTITVYQPEAAQALPLLFTFLNRQESDALAGLLQGRAVLAAIDEPDWEQAFSPWAAPRVFKNAVDFGGGADGYLAWLAAEVLPEAMRRAKLKPAWCGVLGYSLAGLFAAYCAYKQPLFERTAAVSASLWFDGWQQFIEEQRPPFLPEYAYFSVGDQEKNAKNPRLAQIETAVAATCRNWQAHGAAAVFETNSGGHFADIPQRLAKAAFWLLAQ